MWYHSWGAGQRGLSRSLSAEGGQVSQVGSAAAEQFPANPRELSFSFPGVLCILRSRAVAASSQQRATARADAQDPRVEPQDVWASTIKGDKTWLYLPALAKSLSNLRTEDHRRKKQFEPLSDGSGHGGEVTGLFVIFEQRLRALRFRQSLISTQYLSILESHLPLTTHKRIRTQRRQTVFLEPDIDRNLDTNIPISGDANDPTYRIGKLESATCELLSVIPDFPISKAITLMLMHDYSQLPVMTNDRDVKGMISWKTIGSRLALGKSATLVGECMEVPQIVSASNSLFSVIAQIVKFDSVLVRGQDKTITGIVTTSDLSVQFRQLSEPFLLLEEIENHIRNVIDGHFRCCRIVDGKRRIGYHSQH